MRYPETMLWPISSLTSGMPLRGKHLVVYPEKREVKPHREETEVVNLGIGGERKKVKVSTCMSANVQEELAALLRDYQDIFTWSYQDMPGWSLDIMQHRLPLNPECSSVKQKLRRMKPEMSLKMKEEVKKQFDTGFLSVAQSLEWVANIILIPKKDGKV